MFWSTDLAEREGAEQLGLVGRTAELQQVADRAGSLSDQGLLELIDQGAVFASDAFFSRRNYIGLFVLPHLLRWLLRRLFPGDGEVLHADLMAESIM